MSLPHARGGVSRTASPDPLPRVFPTHVGGVSTRVFERDGGYVSSPRTWGVSDGQVYVYPGRASPRTWGCFHTSLRRGRTQYVFPTHVGVFLRRLIAVMISGVFPRT